MAIPEHILEAIDKLPALTPAAAEVIALAQTKDHSLADLAKIIANDPLLSARLLKTVNSAACGLVKRIDNIERAVIYLGERVAIAAAFWSSMGKLCERPLDGYGAGAFELWRHLLAAALAGRALAVYTQDALSPETAYTACLLHDIGKIALSDFLCGRAQEAVDKCEKGLAADYLESEHMLVDADHCEAGEAMARRWRLPENLAAAIRWHHAPEQAREWLSLAWTAHIADFLAMMMGCGTGADALRYRLRPGYNQHLRLERRTLEKLAFEISVELERNLAIFEEFRNIS